MGHAEALILYPGVAELVPRHIWDTIPPIHRFLIHPVNPLETRAKAGFPNRFLHPKNLA